MATSKRVMKLAEKVVAKKSKGKGKLGADQTKVAKDVIKKGKKKIGY